MSQDVLTPPEHVKTELEEIEKKVDFYQKSTPGWCVETEVAWRIQFLTSRIKHWAKKLGAVDTMMSKCKEKTPRHKKYERVSADLEAVVDLLSEELSKFVAQNFKPK